MKPFNNLYIGACTRPPRRLHAISLVYTQNRKVKLKVVVNDGVHVLCLQTSFFDFLMSVLIHQVLSKYIVVPHSRTSKPQFHTYRD